MAAEPIVRFSIADPRRSYRQVRLYQELERPHDGPAFAYDAARRAWVAELATRDAWRVEYLVNLQLVDGGWSRGLDPSNPKTAPGPFGDKSVVELAGYRPPAWVSAGSDGGEVEPVAVMSRRLGREVPVVLWTPPGYEAEDRLPLLVALDGPELAAYSSLLALLSVTTPVHVALVAPIERDGEYSASPAFARALATEVLPAVAARRNVPERPEGRAALGVSLGAVAALHVQRTHPDLFGALFLQSGSFFQRRTDPQEAGFSRWARLVRFVGIALRGYGAVHPTRVVLTCGTVEENLANNRVMRDALAAQGYDVEWVEHPDGHNWVSWRDVLDPHLPALLAGLKP